MNSQLGLNEAITTQIAVTPDGNPELMYGSLDYEQPIGPYGTRVGATVSYTETEPGYLLEQFDVEGQSHYYSLRLEHPFIRSRRQNVDASVQFDWRDIENDNNIPDFREDNIRALRAGVNYGFTDKLFNPAANELSLVMSQGIDILGASDEDDAQLSRPDASSVFTKANLVASRLQKIKGPVNLKLTVRGQLSSGPLLSSEEFGVGGYYSGRGYDPSEISAMTVFQDRQNFNGLILYRSRIIT